jgi:hypothetical protein
MRLKFLVILTNATQETGLNATNKLKLFIKWAKLLNSFKLKIVLLK